MSKISSSTPRWGGNALALHLVHLAGQSDAHQAVGGAGHHDPDDLVSVPVDAQADGAVAFGAVENLGLHHQPRVDELADDVGNGGPLQVGHPGQLRPGAALLTAQRVDHQGAVEFELFGVVDSTGD